MEESPGTPPKPTKQPWPFGLHIFQEEWPEVKKALTSFILCAILCICIGAVAAYWLVDHLYAAESRAKDATIQSLQQQLQAKQLDTPAPAVIKPDVNQRQPTGPDDSVAVGPGAKSFGGSVAIGKNATAGVPSAAPVKTIGDSIVNSKDSAIIRSGVFNGNNIIASSGSSITPPTTQGSNSPIVQTGLASAVSFNQSGGVTAGTYIATNQTAIYQGLKPFIFRVRVITTNSFENGAYKNVYEVQIGNPSDKMKWHVSGMPPLVDSPVTENAGGGQVFAKAGSFQETTCNITALTALPVQQTNIVFSIEAVPSQ